MAAQAAASKGGTDTIVLEVQPVLGIVDWFVITSGTNPRQVRTIAEEVERQVGQVGERVPPKREGLAEGRWVLLDFGDVVVHVFLDEARSYYEIEALWSDMAQLSWEDAAAVRGSRVGPEGA